MVTTRTMTRPRSTHVGGFDTFRLVLGTFTLVLGIAVLAAPETIQLVIALAFGVQLLVSGLIKAVIGTREPGWRRGLTVVLGALTVVAGIVCVLQPGTSLLVLLVTVALGWLSNGVSELVFGITVEQPPAQRLVVILLGVTSILGAVLVAVLPGTSLAVFTATGGVLLVALGAFTLLAARRSRRSGGSKGRAATS